MMAEFFPRRKEREPSHYIDFFCHWDDALKKHLVCPEFYLAKQKRELIPDRYTGTWVIPGSVTRDMSWSARHYAGERGNFEDHTGDFYGWWDCPHCGGETEFIPLVGTEP